MSDDADLLAEELAWTATYREVRGWNGKKKRQQTNVTPRGVSAMMALATVYGLALVAGTLAWWSRTPHVPSSYVIDPGGCGLLLVLGVELFVARALGRWTWQAVGPQVRAVMRPLMVLGPVGFFVVGGLGVMLLSGLATAARAGAFTPAPTAGDNWRYAPDTAPLGFDAATVRCFELGDAWGVPTAAELAAFRPAFRLPFGKRSPHFWLSPATPDGVPLQVRQQCEGFSCRLVNEPAAEAEAMARALCFRR